MAAYDLVEVGPALTLARQPGPGVCGVECRTLAMAVSDALDAADTDLAERLYAATAGGSPAPDLSTWLCGGADGGCGACDSKPPPLPPTRPPGPAFVPEAPDAAQARRMMAQMKAAGMGGELFDRASIEETLAAADEEEEAAGMSAAAAKQARNGKAAAADAPIIEGLGGALDEPALDFVPPPGVGEGASAAGDTKRAAQARVAAKKAAGGGGGGGGGGGSVATAARGWAAAAAAKARALAGRATGGRVEL